ncbi:hypothetical protein SM124_03825 (plasmid) [Bacillus sp. 31A1R]|uniref:Ribosomal protein L32 n=1 Tax=Robertmurraya mangrovi TaxID=3098077 RepID=A0ABU5IUR4_9BACI|nr:hypothetical protein [Bacillus sp. 31A1R]MDZ5470875.1 hypothetical protein [Bacillus sp. 31A1R]
MSKLNHEAAPNLNLGSKVLRTSNLISDKANHEFFLRNFLTVEKETKSFPAKRSKIENKDGKNNRV